jgi:hypothetical protein
LQDGVEFIDDVVLICHRAGTPALFMADLASAIVYSPK